MPGSQDEKQNPICAGKPSNSRIIKQLMESKRLEIAKKNFHQALEDLEQILMNKIENINSNKGNQEIVRNLHNEINSLQKSLSDLGEENENLRNFKSQTNKIIGHIKLDLSKIKQITNQN